MAAKKGDLGKPTVDLLLATKAIVDRDLGLGFVTEDRLRMTIQARKEEAKALKESGASVRQIAKATGVSKSQAAKDARPQSGQKCPQSGQPLAAAAPLVNTAVQKPPAPPPLPTAPVDEALTTRGLLAQSDQNDWRTPRKFLDAARDVLGAIDLDPATSAEANETVQAAKFYTEADLAVATAHEDTPAKRSRLWQKCGGEFQDRPRKKERNYGIPADERFRPTPGIPPDLRGGLPRNEEPNHHSHLPMTFPSAATTSRSGKQFCNIRRLLVK